MISFLFSIPEKLYPRSSWDAEKPSVFIQENHFSSSVNQSYCVDNNKPKKSLIYEPAAGRQSAQRTGKNGQRADSVKDSGFQSSQTGRTVLWCYRRGLVPPKFPMSFGLGCKISCSEQLKDLAFPTPPPHNTTFWPCHQSHSKTPVTSRAPSQAGANWQLRKGGAWCCLFARNWDEFWGIPYWKRTIII